MLRSVGWCWLKFDHFQTRANDTQHVATHRNTVAKRTQHVAPNNVGICCVGMLRSFGRGFSVRNEFFKAEGIQNTSQKLFILDEALPVEALIKCAACKLFSS